MGTGRTTPALCGCEDAGGNPAGDFIVKLRGGIERGGTGLAAELIASRLAAYFGIPAPSPVLVFIASDFANSVSLAYPDKAALMTASIGLNFGSQRRDNVASGQSDPKRHVAGRRVYLRLRRAHSESRPKITQICSVAATRSLSSTSSTMNWRFRSLRKSGPPKPRGAWAAILT